MERDQSQHLHHLQQQLGVVDRKPVLEVADLTRQVDERVLTKVFEDYTTCPVWYGYMDPRTRGCFLVCTLDMCTRVCGVCAYICVCTPLAV
jgi:hypothetical protein